MSHPTVSVIIPTYNRADFVIDAIESVLTQDFEGYELIVVDDGSTDDTSNRLKAYSEIRLVRQDRRGVSAARNAGLAAASGEFIGFLDSDDLWLPRKLSVQTAFFRGTPAAHVCQTEEVWIRRGKRLNPGKRHRKPSGMIFEPSLELCLVSPSAVMIRRTLLERMGGFDETLPACEDYDLWLRIACRLPVYLLPDALVVKRGGRADQLSAQPGLDRFRIQALKKILEAGVLTAGQYAAALNVLEKKCALYALGCAKRGRQEEANHYRDLPNTFRPKTFRNGRPAFSHAF